MTGPISMKYKVGDLIRIVRTVDIDTFGRPCQKLEEKYIGMIGLIESISIHSDYYNVLIGNEKETTELYEEEVELVNG